MSGQNICPTSCATLPALHACDDLFMIHDNGRLYDAPAEDKLKGTTEVALDLSLKKFASFSSLMNGY